MSAQRVTSYDFCLGYGYNGTLKPLKVNGRGCSAIGKLKIIDLLNLYKCYMTVFGNGYILNINLDTLKVP